MNKVIPALIAATLSTCLSVSAALYKYPDATGDTFANGYDIAGVDVSNTDSTLTFKIYLNGDAANTIRYLVAIDSASGGNFSDGGPVPWSSSAKLSGMDYFISGGPESGTSQLLRQWANNRWEVIAEPLVESSSSSYTYTISTAGMNLNPGNTVKFDVYTATETSGWGLADVLSTPTQIGGDWNNNYAATGFNLYTVTAVPEPAQYGLICAGGLLGIVVFQNIRKNRKQAPVS